MAWIPACAGMTTAAPAWSSAAWNFAHLANASKRVHIEVLNRRLHLSSPVICSPEELMIEPPD